MACFVIETIALSPTETAVATRTESPVETSLAKKLAGFHDSHHGFFAVVRYDMSFTRPF